MHRNETTCSKNIHDIPKNRKTPAILGNILPSTIRHAPIPHYVPTGRSISITILYTPQR